MVMNLARRDYDYGSHGPSMLCLFLVLQAGDARLTDTRQDEQDRCITIKSTGEDGCPSLSSQQMLYRGVARSM